MGGKSSTTTQSVKIPKEVMARYNAVNTRAEGLADTPFKQYGTDPSDFVAQINAQQQGGIDAVNAAAGSYAPYFDAATAAGTAGMGSAQPQELDIQRYMNPYQQQVIDATMRQMGQANEQAQSGALGTAASSGAFGGDRAGIAAANLANQQGMAMGSTLAGLNAQNYGQALQTAQQQQGVNLGATQADLERLMQGGQFMAGLGTARQQAGLQGAEAQINAGTLGQQTEQAGKTAMYNQFQQEQAYPFQIAQFLANIAMGTGALSGSTTSTTQPSSWFSDRRLKEDIRRIGHTDDGMPIYKYKYKGDENHQTHIGFMADEVEQVKPEAVGVSGGYKTVDYDRATKAGGGGVAGPYGSQAGSDNPYAAGYVPQAYLPVGQLMLPDSSALDNANQSAAAQLEAAANFGENIVKLRDTFGPGGDLYKTRAQREAEAATGAKTDPSVDTTQPETVTTTAQPNWRGGVAGYAAGGPAYLQHQSGAANPVSGKTYLNDTLKQQEAQKPPELKQAGSAPESRSTMDDLSSLAGTAASIASLLSMSDRRAKHSIRRIGRTDHGMPIYSFKYKGDDREQTHIGFMADEVEKDHPDAVMTGHDGYKRVDYGQAHKFYQGGAVNRPAYEPGGVIPAPEGTPEERARRMAEVLSAAAGDAPAASTAPAAERPALSMPASVSPATAPAAGVAGGENRLSFTPTAATGVAPPAVAAGYPVARQSAPAPAGGVIPAQSALPISMGAPQRPAEGGVSEGVGVTPKKQLEFMSHELQLPEYKPYQETDWGTPERAAVGFEQIYERAGGSNNDKAAKNARDVYDAAMSGDMSGLPQNVQMAYQHFTSNGMTPVHAAGAVGRLMVESYENLNPNARLIDGSGNGTYGFAQWRGPRLQALADFAGVPLDAITGLPATSGGSGGVGGGGLSVSTSNTPAGVSGGYGIGGDKPWEDRTTMGKMMFDRDGRVNKDALLSILGGIGTMASSPSRYLGAAILQGIGGAANTYMAQEARRSDITGKNLENLRQVAMDTMRWNDMNETNLTPQQYASMMKINLDIPQGATVQDILSGAYTPTTGGSLKKLSYREFQSGTVNIGGHTVPMQNDPASLQRYIQDNGIYRNDPVLGGDIAAAEARLQEIKENGRIYDINGNEIVDPRTVAALDDQTQNAANREATAAFRTQMNARLPLIPVEIDATMKQANVFANLEAGALTNETTALAAMADALGLPAPAGAVADRAQVERALKYAAEREITRASGLGATQEQLRVIGNVSANPNLQPEAVKAVLTAQLANSLREKAMYELRDDWAASEAANGKPMDQNAYAEWFNANEPYEKYYEAARESMPRFAGELGSQEKPHPAGTDPNKIGVGDYFVLNNGQIGQREE